MSIHLSIMFSPWGAHPAAWRAPDNNADFANLESYLEIARHAERGAIDALFVADEIVVPSGPEFGPWGWLPLDPIVLLTAIATATTDIGLILTASTTHNLPFNLARQLASLDVVSGGRLGWNIVTSANPRSGTQLGNDQGVRAEEPGQNRYTRATEFVDVVTSLWKSWSPGTRFGANKEGTFVDVNAARPVTHHGKHFRLDEALLPVPPSPQGRPLLLQAGMSEAGRAFSATYADAVFSVQGTLGEAQSFYADMKRRAAFSGRLADSLRVLPGIHIYLEDSAGNARRLRRELDELQGDRHALVYFADRMGLDPDRLHMDKPLPEGIFDDVRPGIPAFYRRVAEMVRQENPSVRQIIESGVHFHRNFVGTPEGLAASMEEWVSAKGADGFNLSPGRGLRDVIAVVEGTVPALVRRGLRHASYHGQTLRDRYSPRVADVSPAHT